MNILLNGVYKVVLNINDEKSEENDIPVILELTKEMIGIRGFEPEREDYTSEDIMIRDPSAVLKYDKSVV